MKIDTDGVVFSVDEAIWNVIQFLIDEINKKM
jgi:hypothetical protein